MQRYKMENNKELRREILAAVKEESRRHRKQGKRCVPLKAREQLAERFGVSTATITNIVSEAGLIWQRQWTDEERRDVWCNYEEMGAKVLAIKYNVTPRAIIQMIYNMRQAEAKTPNPWQKE